MLPFRKFVLLEGISKEGGEEEKKEKGEKSPNQRSKQKALPKMMFLWLNSHEVPAFA